MPLFSSTIGRELDEYLGETISVKSYGAVGDGVTDDSSAFQLAINKLKDFKGKRLLIPAGTYLLNTPIEFGAFSYKLFIFGEGRSSIIKRGATLPDNKGLFTLEGSSDIVFSNLSIDGNIKVPTGLTYGAGTAGTNFNNDPMNVKLTKDTSFWIKANCKNIKLLDLHIQYTGGYAILVDAETGDINNIELNNNVVENSLTHLFGFVPGDMTYGSWTGGFLFRGNCVDSETPGAARLGRIKNVKVIGNSFSRVNGNCIWMHSYGFDSHHEGFIINNNSSEYVGRDTVLVGNLLGGSASGNYAYKNGYVVLTDGSAPVPKALADNYAVAYDSSGWVSEFTYANNVADEFLGGGFDLDGLRNSDVVNNIVRTTNTAVAKGIQTGDTSANGGGYKVNISGNKISGCLYGAIVLNQARYCRCSNNIIDHDDGDSNPATGYPTAPILLYSLDNKTFGNVVNNNTIIYNTNNFAIVESDNGTGTGFNSSIINYVHDNLVIGGLGEFYSHALSNSTTGKIISSEVSTPSSKQELSLTRIGENTSSRFYIKDTKGTTTKTFFELDLSEGKLVVTNDGSKGKVTSGQIEAKQFVVILAKNATAPEYADADADVYNSDNTLIRADKVAKKLEVSFENIAGSRVWQDLLGGGSGPTFTIDNAIPFVDGTVLTESAKLLFNNDATNNTLIVIKKSNTQVNNLFETRLEDGNTLLTVIDSSGVLYAPAAAFRAALGSSSTNELKIGASELRFKQNVGDNADSAMIEYKAANIPFVGAAASLRLTGVGTSATNRIVEIRDYCVVQGVGGQASLEVKDGYILTDEGLASLNNSVNTLNIPNGGTTAKVINATHYSLMGKNVDAPGTGGNPLLTGLPTLVKGVFFYNETNDRPEYYDGVGWQPFSSGGGSAPGSDKQILYNSTGTIAAAADVTYNSSTKVFKVQGTPNQTFGVDGLVYETVDTDATRTLAFRIGTLLGASIHYTGPGFTGNLMQVTPTQILYAGNFQVSVSTGLATFSNKVVVTGVNNEAAITASNGYADFAQGYYSNNSSYETLKLLSGGGRAKSFSAENYMKMGAGTSDPSVLTSGDSLTAGTFYFNTVSDVVRVYDGASWISLGAGGGGGVTSVSGSGNISVSPTTGACVVSITSSPTFSSLTTTGACNVNSLSVSGSSLFTGSISTLSSLSVATALTAQSLSLNGVSPGAGNIRATGAIFTGGIEAAGYNVTGGFIGQNWQIGVNPTAGFDVYNDSGVFIATYSRLVFKGGVLVGIVV